MKSTSSSKKEDEERREARQVQMGSAGRARDEFVIGLMRWPFDDYRDRLRRTAMVFGIGLAVLRVGLASPATSLKEIQQMIQAGQLDGARSHLMEILKRTPDDPVALNFLGVVNAQQGQLQEAERCYRRAATVAPEFLGAYLNLGRLYLEHAGRDPKALKESEAAYEAALKIDPANAEANYQTAFVLWRLGAFQPSLDRLGRLPPTSQGRPQALALNCADHASLQGAARTKEACDHLLQQPDLMEADVITVVPELLAQRQNDVVIQLLAGLEQRGLASPKTLHQLALLYQEQGQLPAARATLEKLVSSPAGASAPLLTELARVAYRQKDGDGAIGYLAHARQLEPENPEVLFFFGMVCLEKGYQEEAYQSLRKAAELKPDNASYNYAVGAVMMSRRNVQEAYPFLQKYCQLKPADPRGHLALGSAYFYGHDADLARKEIESVAANPQTSASAHYFLGRLANQDGDFSTGVRNLQEAIRLRPSYAEAYAELGYSLVKLRQNAAAEKTLRHALELNPQSYTANLSLMMLYARTKDPRVAEQTDRFNQVREVREQREKEFLRTIVVAPF